MAVELAIGDTSLHVASEFPDAGVVSPSTIGGTATVLQIQTDDADALWAQALDAGAEVRHELADQFWGERHGQIVDPFGHRWNIAQHFRDVTPEELAAAPPRPSEAAGCLPQFCPRAAASVSADKASGARPRSAARPTASPTSRGNAAWSTAARGVLRD